MRIRNGGKVILFMLILAALLIAGCSTGVDRRQCVEGDHCRYYQGTRGIIMQTEGPPRDLNFYHSDILDPDGNSVEINVRLRNDGASDSYGAVFLSGFAPEIFDLFFVDQFGHERQFLIGRATQTCYFDIRSFSSGSGGGIFNIPFNFQCQGIQGGSSGTGGFNLGINVGQVGSLFGWDLPNVNINVGVTGNGSFNIGVGFEGFLFNVLHHGKLLMIIVAETLNFEAFNGAEFTMRGDNPENPGGDIDFKTFRVRMKGDWPAGTDFYDINYNIKSCYAYTTFVSPMICVDPDPYSAETKVCRPDVIQYTGSQGGPVGVTRITQTTTRNEVVMDIQIRNMGPGTVWDVGHLERCSPYFPGTVRESMKNVVYVGQAMVGDTLLDCSGRMVRLDPNTRSAQVTCRYPLMHASDVGSAYTVPLRMELWYGYEENINQRIRVRRRG